MTTPPSVQTAPLISDEKIRDALRRELGRAINVERTFTRQQIALESGINIHTIDAIISRDPAKHRRVCAGDALSIACVLGARCVGGIMALIGYSAAPLDEADVMQPMQIVADCMSDFSVIAQAAADGRFDHTEMPSVRDAADHIIATVLPLSRAGSSA